MQNHDSAHVYLERAGDRDSNSLSGHDEFVIDDETTEGDLDVPIPFQLGAGVVLP